MSNFEKFPSVSILRKMIHPSSTAISKRVLVLLLGSLMATNLRQVSTEQSNALDGTAGDLVRFLRELVEMTGQANGVHATPILELQFGDVLTKSSLTTPDGVPFLTVTALLPCMDQPEYVPTTLQPAISSAFGGKWEFFWHADNGHYVIEHQIAVDVLRDERSVMDAIADTSDQVTKWFARVNVERPPTM